MARFAAEASDAVRAESLPTTTASDLEVSPVLRMLAERAAVAEVQGVTRVPSIEYDMYSRNCIGNDTESALEARARRMDSPLRPGAFRVPCGKGKRRAHAARAFSKKRTDLGLYRFVSHVVSRATDVLSWAEYTDCHSTCAEVFINEPLLAIHAMSLLNQRMRGRSALHSRSVGAAVLSGILIGAHHLEARLGNPLQALHIAKPFARFVVRFGTHWALSLPEFNADPCPDTPQFSALMAALVVADRFDNGGTSVATTLYERLVPKFAGTIFFMSFGRCLYPLFDDVTICSLSEWASPTHTLAAAASAIRVAYSTTNFKPLPGYLCSIDMSSSKQLRLYPACAGILVLRTCIGVARALCLRSGIPPLIRKAILRHAIVIAHRFGGSGIMLPTPAAQLTRVLFCIFRDALVAIPDKEFSPRAVNALVWAGVLSRFQRRPEAALRLLYDPTYGVPTSREVLAHISDEPKDVQRDVIESLCSITTTYQYKFADRDYDPRQLPHAGENAARFVTSACDIASACDLSGIVRQVIHPRGLHPPELEPSAFLSAAFAL